MSSSVSRNGQRTQTDHVIASQIPRELIELPQWVLWKTEQRNGDKPTKLPYRVNGALAKSNDPQSWTTFERALTRFERGGYSGIGFVFSADDPYCGIDLDGCRDPQTGIIANWAQRIILDFDTYCEISPSQSGVKLFVRGKLPFEKGRKEPVPAEQGYAGKAPGIEVYDHGRYFAVTGQRLKDVPATCEDRQQELDALCRTHFPARPAPTANNRHDHRVIDRARKYLATIPPAVSGESGHNKTFKAACTLVIGFDLSSVEAYPLLAEWNQACQPPWLEHELHHKLEDADKQPGPRGTLRHAPLPATGTQQGDRPAPIIKPIVRRLSAVKAERLEWLWPGRIPLGKLTLLAGDPGLGKSFLTLDIAARLSSGRGWPDNFSAGQQRGGVVILSAEDDLADTIRPRLDRAGADVDRIVAVEAMTTIDADTGTTGRRGFSLERDLTALAEVIDDLDDCRLVVIDPISSYLGKVDSHKNADVRALLAPLADLASRHRVAVVAVTHLSKANGGKAVYRAMGSLAFAAAARAVWGVAKDQANPDRRLLLPIKMNLSRDAEGLAFAISDECVAWDADPVRMTADDLFAAEAETDRDSNGTDWQEAADWLMDVLSDGPIPAKEIQRLANATGIKEKPLRRAKEKLRIASRREGFGRDSRVIWSMPDQVESSIDAHDSHRCPTKNVGIYGDVGHLCAPEAGDDSS